MPAGTPGRGQEGRVDGKQPREQAGDTGLNATAAGAVGISGVRCG